MITGPVTNWTVIALLGTVMGLGGTWVESLFVDGIIAGVGGVLVFVPVLMSLYFVPWLYLEDSGYMARAAFVMDRLMQPVGAARQKLPADDRRALAATVPGDVRHPHSGK